MSEEPRQDPYELFERYHQVEYAFQEANRDITTHFNQEQSKATRNYQQTLRGLKDKIRESDRQLRIEQTKLDQRYDHQQQAMRQRHGDFVQIGDHLLKIDQLEDQQLGNERNIHQIQKRLKQQRQHIRVRESRVLSKREMLEQQKQIIMDQLEELDKLNELNEDIDNDVLPMIPLRMELDHDLTSSYYDFSFDSRKAMDGLSLECEGSPNFETRSIIPVAAEPVRNGNKSEKKKSKSKWGLVQSFVRGSSSKKKAKKKMSKKKSVKKSPTISGNLYVRLVDARDVFGPDGNAPNTFVQLELDGQVQASSTSDYSHTPYWNEVFQFKIRDYNAGTLNLRLIDAFTNRTLAKMKVPCNRFLQNGDEVLDEFPE